MGSFSDSLENSIINHILGSGSYTPAATVYIGLSTADPTDSAAGLAEPSGNNYGRIACAFGAAAARAVSNSGLLTFPQASGSWGTITHWALFTASSAGTMIAYGSLSVSKLVVSGNTPTFAIGQVSVSISSGAVSDYLANKILDFVLRNQAFSVPTIYAGLATATINDNTTGATVTEVSGNNYARKAQAAWNAASGGAADNNGVITFNTPSGAWGTVTYNFIVDSITAGAGNILFYSVQNPNQAPGNGDTVQFASGAWDVSLS